jgi:UDP-N-acetylmuramyl pentapeptide synthase
MYRIFNKFFPILDTLYFLQLSNYNTKIFLTKAHYFYTRRNLQVRDHLVFTSKIKLIILEYILLLFLLGLLFQFWVIIVIIFTPYLITGINFVLQFVTQIREDIKLKSLNLKDQKELEIILITGSQGKTTLKYMLYNAVKAFRRTQIVPDNINTTSGVINWLSKNLLGNTQLLIFETEPFYPCELTKIIEAMKPRFRILTNLTDQHLMRFGSQEKLHAAYLEVVKDSEGCVLLSGIPHSFIQPLLGTISARLSLFKIPQANNAQLDFIKANNQPEYMSSYLAICESVLRELDVAQKFQSFSKDWIKGLPQRRKNILALWGHEVIDDSYNISLESAKISIDFGLHYAGKEGKKLIIITAGIPESSSNPLDANVVFGKYLRPMIDDEIVNVILLQSEFYPFIKNEITRYQSAKNLIDIPAILNRYNALEYTVLFLPELNDFYY